MRTLQNCVLDLITNIEIVNFDHWHPKLDACKTRDFKAMSGRTHFCWGNGIKIKIFRTIFPQKKDLKFLKIIVSFRKNTKKVRD